jgi:hypothetical protein
LKKWIIGAFVVAAALVAAIVVLKPWRPGGRPPRDAQEAAELARLDAANQRAKADSERIKAERAKIEPFDPENQRAPFEKKKPTAEQEQAAAALHEHDDDKKAREPLDMAGHERENAVVKAEAIDLRPDALVRPETAPKWDAPQAIDWAHLSKLFTGFAIGYRMGGDFTKGVVDELHGTAAKIDGAVLPIDPPKGPMKRFWLVEEHTAADSCPYCKPPSHGKMIFVDASKRPLEVDRKQLYEGVVTIGAVGRFLLGPAKTGDGIEYLYGLELKEATVLK